MIEPLASQLARYFYFHGVRGALLKALGSIEDAREAWRRAIALAGGIEATYIRQELNQLANEPTIVVPAEQTSTMGSNNFR